MRTLYVEWTTGFWTGCIWLSYEYTKDPAFREAATKQVDSFLNRIEKRIDVNHHDMGFLYSLSKRLLQKYDTILLIAWGMFIGGFCTNFVAPFWRFEGVLNPVSIGCILFVIFFGAMLPYLTFLYGVKYIGPTKSSLLASVEPLSSTVASVLWLHTHLEWIDYIGIGCIIATVFLLSIQPKKKEQTAVQ